jgi:hypothetical protein
MDVEGQKVIANSAQALLIAAKYCDMFDLCEHPLCF